MRHYTYLLLLAACFVGTLPLELLVGARVYAQGRRLLLTLVPTIVIFVAWDVWAIAAKTWTYDRAYLVGIRLPGRLPLEEFLFFVIIPTCAILTLEAVRVRRPTWVIGDEP